jgi:hypothetical protein
VAHLRSRYAGEDQALVCPCRRSRLFTGKGAVFLKAVQVKSVYLWLAGQPVSQLAGIKLRANRHDGPTGTPFFNFSSLQTIAPYLLAEPVNFDSRNAGQARPIEDPALAGMDQVFKG